MANKEKIPYFCKVVLQNFPFIEEDFDALTQYQLISKVVEYLNKVIKSQNTLVDNVNNLSVAFQQLHDYVENYFANLDVQEEINNKLDEMAEDGTLQEIITAYIQSNVAWTFDTVADMKLTTNLVDGSYAQTLGFHSLNDGGGAIYYITDSGTANEMDVIAIGSLNANLTVTSSVKPEQLGAYGDDTEDDTNYIQRAFDFAKDKHAKVEFYEKTYKITATLKTYTNCMYDGNNATIHQTSDLPVMATAKYFDETNSGYNVNIKNFNLTGNTSNTNNDGLIICGWYDFIENVKISNVGGHGIVITSYTNDGNEITGSTLVEGRITNCKAYISGATKYAFYVHCNSVVVTDWRIMNCQFGNPECAEFMHFDRVAGWFLDNVQCYGKASDYGIYANNASGSHFNNITLDGICNYGIGFLAQLGTAEVNNLHVNVHSSVASTDNVAVFRQNGGSSTPNPLQTNNINVVIMGSATPNLYLHWGSAYIFDASNVSMVKNHAEVGFKTYYNRSSGDTYRLNGFLVTEQQVSFGDINTLSRRSGTYKSANDSTTITFTVTPTGELRNSGLLIITGEVNGAPRGGSVYAVGLGQRGTTQAVTLINEDSSYPFTNVSVTKNGSNYDVSITTPATNNCIYFADLLY